MIDRKNILGVDITSATKKEILEYIVKNLENFKKKLFLTTPNPEFLVLASKNSTFKNILNRADLASADGIGVLVAAKILGKQLKERFTGVDLVESLCEKVAEKPITVGFLGGGEGVAEKTAECLREKYPKLKVAFAGQEWPSNHRTTVYGLQSTAELKTTVDGSQWTVDILFVAFGAPKQEFWISENLEKIPVKIAIGVGGAFDYISGRVPRAPAFLRNLGFEWFYRLIRQPWRIKRQLALLEFIFLVLKEKLNKK